MSLGHDHAHDSNLFTGQDPAFRRALMIVMLINAVMFFLEVGAGHWALSQALLADALDFFADTLTYGLSFLVLGMADGVRRWAARAKAWSLVAMGGYVMVSTLIQVFVLAVPDAIVMGGVGVLAFSANLLSVLLLYRWRRGDANIRSVWLCSRSDMLGNMVVVVAALGVFGTGTAWPDLLVAAILSGLFLWSAVQIFAQARHEDHAEHQG